MPKEPDKTSEPKTKDPEDRIRELEERAADLTGGQMTSWASEDAPPEVLEKFWENVVAFEESGWVEPFDVLVQGGIELPSPGDLDGEALRAKLWELIRVMALLHMYLEQTDHLSDRELYTVLWEEHLHEEAVLPMGEPGGNYIIDMLGSGSEEDIHIHLLHYADEEYRRHWAQDWPDDEIPDHEDPPYDRDRQLPRPDWRPPEPNAGKPM